MTPPWLIFPFGYLHFFLVAFWVHDMKTTKSKLLALDLIYGVDAIGLIVFGGILGWI